MLEDAGIKTSLLHPAKTKVIAYARLKNDKVDSEVISDLLRSDMIYESFVPDSYRDLRNLTRVMVKLTRKSTEMKNMAYAILAKYDHAKPDCGLFTRKGQVAPSHKDVRAGPHGDGCAPGRDGRCRLQGCRARFEDRQDRDLRRESQADHDDARHRILHRAVRNRGDRLRQEVRHG